MAADVVAGRLALLPVSGAELAQHSAYGIVSRAGHSLSPGAEGFRRLLLDQQAEAGLPAPPGDETAAA